MNKLFHTYISKKFMAIFWASTLAMLIEYLLNLSDSIIIGHFWGEKGLTAVSAVLPFYSFVVFAAYMIACGTGVRYAYHKGRDESRLADEYFSQAIILSVAGGLALSAVTLWGKSAFLGLLELPAGAEQLAEGYYFGYALLPLPQFLFAALYTLVLYMGGESYCSISSVLMFVLNIGISLLLANTIGIEGVSLGTAVANLLCLAPLVVFLFTEKGRTRFYLTLAHVGTMAHISFAEASVFLFVSAEAMLLNIYLQDTFSGMVLVIFSVIANMQVFFLTLFEGLCEYATVMVSIYYGERNLPAIRQLMHFLLKAAVVECAVLLAAMLLAAGWLPDAFGITEPSAVEQAVEAARLYLPCLFGFCLLKLLAAYYICVEKIGLSVAISFLHLLVVPVIGAVCGGWLAGLQGAWIGLGLSQYAVCLVAWGYLQYFQQGGWLCLEEKGSEGLLLNLVVGSTELQAAWQQLGTYLQAAGIAPAACERIAADMKALPCFTAGNGNIVELTALHDESVKIILRDTAELYADAVGLQLENEFFVQTYSPAAGNNRIILELKEAGCRA